MKTSNDRKKVHFFKNGQRLQMIMKITKNKISKII